MKDLIVLTADSNIKFCLEGLLPRVPNSLGCHNFDYDIFVHPLRDPGCRTQSDEYLRSFVYQYRYCLVVFDKEGAGGRGKNRLELQQEVEQALSVNGWEGRWEVIVIDPEIENWIWVKSPRLAQASGWSDVGDLYEWLSERRFIVPGESKPTRPKEAFELALRKTKKKRSSAIYKNIAEKVTFKDCNDLAFLEMRNTLINWFTL